MIKVQNNTAAREAIPSFLYGLAPESLADLAWTDPALGVSDAAWWPEVDESPALAQHQRYGAETLTIDADAKVVRVVREVVPWSDAEIAAEQTAADEQRRANIKAQIAALDLRRIRPLAEGDTEYLATLNAQITDLRSQL